MPGALVDGRITVGIAARMSVVAGGNIKSAVRAELDRARMMTTLAPLLAELQHDLLACERERVAVHGETTQALADKILWRIIEINPVVRSESRVQREPEESVFLFCKNLEFTGGQNFARGRFVNLQLARDFVEKDSAIGRQFQFHWLWHPFREHFHFEAIVRRRA